MKNLLITFLALWATQAIAQVPSEVKAGSVVVGAPTGGNCGTGCINAQAIDVNGTPVSGGGGTGANPSATVGLTTVNGSATTFLRSDGAPPLSQAIIPTWTGLHTFAGDVDFTSPATFSNNELLLLGTSTGATTLHSANSSATNYTLTLPAITDTVATITGNIASATNIAGGALNDIPVQSSAGVTAYIAAPSGATALVLEWNGTNIVWAAGTPLSGLTSVSSLSLTDLVGDQPGGTGNLESATVAQLQAQHLNPLGTITATSLTPDCSWPNEVNTAKVTTVTGTFTINNPTVGTPTDVYSCKLIVLFSNPQTAAFGTAYYGGTVALPTTFAANQQKYLFLYASTAVATTAGWDFSADALGFSHYRQQISFGLPRLGKFAGRPATNDDYFKPLWKDAI